MPITGNYEAQNDQLITEIVPLSRASAAQNIHFQVLKCVKIVELLHFLSSLWDWLDATLLVTESRGNRHSIPTEKDLRLTQANISEWGEITLFWYTG